MTLLRRREVGRGRGVTLLRSVEGGRRGSSVSSEKGGVTLLRRGEGGRGEE